MPYGVANAFSEKKIPVGNNMFQCDGPEDIGSITYVISGKEYTLNADEWIYESKFNLAQTG
jgi:hypothetical protein